jgi:nucleoside phosphorylase
MNQSEPVIVRQFMSTIEAQLARGALHAAGIEAIVSADDCGGMRPHLQVGRVALLVRPEDVDQALTILDLPAEGLPDQS